MVLRRKKQWQNKEIQLLGLGSDYTRSVTTQEASPSLHRKLLQIS